MKYNKTIFQPEAEVTGKGKVLSPRTKQKLKGSRRHWSWWAQWHSGGRGHGYAQWCSVSVALRPVRERVGRETWTLGRHEWSMKEEEPEKPPARTHSFWTWAWGDDRSSPWESLMEGSFPAGLGLTESIWRYGYSSWGADVGKWFISMQPLEQLKEH